MKECHNCRGIQKENEESTEKRRKKAIAGSSETEKNGEYVEISDCEEKITVNVRRKIKIAIPRNKIPRVIGPRWETWNKIEVSNRVLKITAIKKNVFDNC